MHLDVTPLLRRPATPERESWLFHHRETTPRKFGQRLIANPYGFAAWFNERMPLDHDFVQMYEARSREYERTVSAGLAEDHPVPPQEDAARKSMGVIVLQLLKRWRNVQYDLRPGRRPPSILISKFVADNVGHTVTLSHELLYQSRQVLAELEHAQAAARRIHVVNPTCPADVLTDRWPTSMEEQGFAANQLRVLLTAVDPGAGHARRCRGVARRVAGVGGAVTPGAVREAGADGPQARRGDPRLPRHADDERAGRGHQQQTPRHRPPRLRLPLARCPHLDAVPLLWRHRTGPAPTHTCLRRLTLSRRESSRSSGQCNDWPDEAVRPQPAPSRRDRRVIRWTGAQRLDSPGAEATSPPHLPTRFPEDPHVVDSQ